MFTLTDVHSLASSSNLTPWLSGQQSKIIQSTTDTSAWTLPFLGFSERDLINSHQNNLIDARDAITKRLNYEGGVLRTTECEYMAGWMVAHTVAEIKQMVTSISSQLPKGSPKGKIVTDEDLKPFGVYQVSSLFNGLEYTQNPLLGITDYIFDSPSKQVLKCVPGLLVRNYHNYYFNALSELGITLRNGRLIWGRNPEAVLSIVKSRGDLIKIPTMLYTQVAGVSFDGRKVDYDVRNKVIHQVLGSSVGYNQSGNGGPDRVQLELIKEIVKQEYIGAIGMGLLLHWMDKGITNNKIPTITLTLLGLDDFGNPALDIVDALREAVMEFSQFKFQLNIEDPSGFGSDYLLSKLGINHIIYNEIILKSPELPLIGNGKPAEFTVISSDKPPNNDLDDINYMIRNILPEETRIHQEYLQLRREMSSVRPVRASHEQYKAYTYLKLASISLSKGATDSQILNATKLRRYNLPVNVNEYVGITRLPIPKSDNILIMSRDKNTGETLVGKPSANMISIVNRIYDKEEPRGTVNLDSSSRLVSFRYDKYISNRLVPIFRFYNSDREYYVIDAELHGNVEDPLRIVGGYDQNILYDPTGNQIRSASEAQFI